MTKRMVRQCETRVVDEWHPGRVEIESKYNELVFLFSTSNSDLPFLSNVLINLMSLGE
jgi:hypothetical protein